MARRGGADSSRVPHHIESVADLPPQAGRREDGHSRRKFEYERPDVDRLLSQASKLLDETPDLQNTQLANTLEMKRRSALLKIRDGQDQATVPGWLKASKVHQQRRAGKSLDQPGYGAPKVKTSVRELEIRATPQSYMPMQLENNSQFDSEMRANLMARNAGRLRAVETRLLTLYDKARHAGRVQADRKAPSYKPDEVMRKLTPSDMQNVHKAFRALGSKMNLTEFVEVMLAHLPGHDWESQTGQVDNICDLYSQLDLDGDGVVTWDEVFEFIIQMGRTTQTASDKPEDVILPYLATQIENRLEGDGDRVGYPDREIERLESLAMVDKIACLEKDSQVIKLYDVETLQLALCLVAHTGVVMRCMHMEGTDYLVSSGTDGCLIFWGAYTATPRQIIPCDAVFTSLVWDITDRVLYAGSSSGAVYAFHVPEADGDRVEIAEGARLQAHADLITDMIVIVDLALLVTASLDSRILVWNVAALNAADPRDLAAQVEPRRVLLGHARGVNSLAYVTSQRYLISAGYESSCNVWNPMIEEPLFTMVGHQSMIAGLKIVVGSNRIVTSDIDGVCKVWDLRNFNCVQTVKDDRIFPGSVASVAYVSRLDRIVLAGFTPKDRKVGRMFALDYERPAQPDMADETAIVEAIHSAVNGTIITASARIVRIWDAKTGLLTQTYPNITEETITAMCLDGRERRIIIGDESGTIGIYNILNGTLIKKLQDHSADICALDYCASTRCILAASWAGRVTIHLDLPDKTMLLRRIDGHGSDITCLTYSLDLGLVGTACMSGEMRMWEFQDVKMRCSFEAHTCEVTLLAFLEEYRCFISGDFLGNMIVWTLSPWREQHTPVVRVEYTVVVGPDGAVRDSPTHAALHAASHTLFVAGSKGVVNAYDTSALLEALVGWQGVDDSGRQPGPLIPALPTRQLLRHPREGRSFVPDPRANRPVSTALLAASGDVTHDIGQHLRFRRDKTGAPQQPRLPATVVRQRFGFVAHTDALTSLRIVREAPGAIAPQTQGEGDAGEAAGAAGAAASGDAADQAAGAEREGGACLLTASSDQTVRLWKLDGAPLGSLQQGATSQTWLWLGASS